MQKHEVDANVHRSRRMLASCGLVERKRDAIVRATVAVETNMSSTRAVPNKSREKTRVSTCSEDNHLSRMSVLLETFCEKAPFARWCPSSAASCIITNSFCQLHNDRTQCHAHHSSFASQRLPRQEANQLQNIKHHVLQLSKVRCHMLHCSHLERTNQLMNAQENLTRSM